MSGFAFSPQFSQRWLTTPHAVKQTIMQELGDIITLLQPETPLEGYRFSVDNLHDSIEDLMQQEAQRQAQLRLEAQQAYEQQLREEQARLEQAEREQARLEEQYLEQQHLEQHLAQQRLEAQSAEQQRLEQDRLAIEQLEQERAIAKQSPLAKQAPSSTNPPTSVADDAAPANANVTVERQSSEMVFAIDHSADPAASVHTNESTVSEYIANTDSKPSVTAPEIDSIKQDIIKQLQGYIDNYLLDSITFMNDDLHKWLATEVEKQLNERLS